MPNPFADCGTIMSGERFIGRQDELRLVDGRLFGEGGFGSLAVIGLPRIGKSSLLAEAVRKAEPKLGALRAVVVREDVGAFGSIDDLFHSLIENLAEKLRERGLATEAVESRAARALEASPITFERVREVFRRIRQAGVRAVCILDEFDAGRYLFTGARQCFHWLRELCSNPEFKAAFVFASKRRLADVARLAGHESDYWANVLMSLTLRPFSPEDRTTFSERLEASGVVADTETSGEVSLVCGRHPYLLDAYAFHAWERVSRGDALGAAWFGESMRGVVREYFQQVTTILRDGSMLGNLVQVIAGPQWSVGPDEVDALVDYGVLSVEEGPRLRGFSEGFEEYVRFVEHSVEIWPLWRNTERALREGLETLLIEAFGESWPSEFKKARPKLAKLIEECEDKMSKEHARFGPRAVSTMLAYTYPLDLFQIMGADWARLGEPLLGRDKQSWGVKFALLSKVRTPLAHNRDEAVAEFERIQAEGICREILQRYEAWNSSVR
jgi:AcrR family transcriptional regulator